MTQIINSDREPFASLLIYRFFKWSFLNPLLLTYFRGKVYGVEKVPQSGALIAVSNHGSYFDPPLIAISLNRPVAYMAKEELFKVPLLKQIIQINGAYPVNRSKSDRSAIKAAISTLSQGWIAGIFLEGTRTHDSIIHNPKLGAALISAKTQTPLLPVSIWNSQNILSQSSIPRPVPITIRIGDIISPPQSTKKKDLEIVTAKCTEAINHLHSLGR